MYRTSEIVPFETNRPLEEGCTQYCARVLKPLTEKEKHAYAETKSTDNMLIGLFDCFTAETTYLPYYKNGDHQDVIYDSLNDYYKHEWWSKKPQTGYVVPEVWDKLIVFRVFIMHSKFPTKEQRMNEAYEPATLFELYRVVMDGPKCWQENYKGELNTTHYDGSRKPPQGGMVLNWLNDKQAHEGINKIAERWGIMQDQTLFSSIGSYPEATMQKFAHIPKKTWMDKSVPDTIRRDLDGHPIFTENLGRSLIDGFVVEHSPGCRIYLGERKLYAFLANPFDGKWTQIRPNKRLCEDPRFKLMRQDRSETNRDALALYERIGGMALLTYQIALTNVRARSQERSSWKYSLPYTWAIYRYKAIEQAEKMEKPFIAWHLAVISTRSTRRVAAPYRTDLMKNKSLETVLGVPGKAIKHIKEAYGRIEHLCVNREERNAAFETAAKSGFPIDQVYYFKVGSGSGNLDDLLIWMARAGKDVRPVLRNIEHLRNSPQPKVVREEDPDEDLFQLHPWEEYLARTRGMMRDYLNMVEIANEVAATPYPAFPRLGSLKELHDKVLRDYNVVKRAMQATDNVIMFEKAIKRQAYSELADQEKEEGFCVLLPKEPMDLVKEGQALNHCVGSYVGQVENGSSMILFLRRKNALKKPYCTMEVQKSGSILSLVQCYNAHNRHDGNKDRVSYIKQWAKRKGVNIACAI